MIIQKVWINNTSKQKLLSVPKSSDIEAGDYVQLIKIEKTEDTEK